MCVYTCVCVYVCVCVTRSLVDPLPPTMQLRDFGFVMVDGTPVSEEATQAATERIGFVRPTMYSPAMWMTEVLPDGGNDTAYSTLPLGPHTDGCYWADQPGIQVFHCLQHAKSGGDTQLVDGFRVLQRLQAEDPEAFDFFKTVPLPFHHSDPTHIYKTLRPVVAVNAAGDATSFTCAS